MSNGWIKLHRQFIDWEWYSDANMVRLFLHLLLAANHKDAKWRGTVVKKGQLITSLGSLSEQTGLTVKQVRTALGKLQETGELGKQSGNQFTVVTVCNYEKYQQRDGEGGKPEGRPEANEGQTKGNKQEVKKEPKPVEQKTLDVVREVIAYLNAKANKSFKASGESTQTMIGARLKEGHTVEDFKAAIDNQCRCWLGTDQEKYLRPSTLFLASKFDGYVNNTRKDSAKIHYLEQRQKDKDMAIRQEMLDMGAI